MLSLLSSSICLGAKARPTLAAQFFRHDECGNCLSVELNRSGPFLQLPIVSNGTRFSRRPSVVRNACPPKRQTDEKRHEKRRVRAVGCNRLLGSRVKRVVLERNLAELRQASVANLQGTTSSACAVVAPSYLRIHFSRLAQ